MNAHIPESKQPKHTARSSNLVVDDLRTELLAACNDSQLPVTVVHLILTDLCNAYAAAERTQLARERADEAKAQADKPPAGKGAANARSD